MANDVSRVTRIGWFAQDPDERYRVFVVPL
jgi:hypothetical protein